MAHKQPIFRITLATSVGVIDSSLFLAGEFYSSNGWNKKWLKKWLLDFLVASILQIPFNSSSKDYMVWLASSTRVLSISSAWERIWQSRNISLVDKFLRDYSISLKISFFAWRLVRRWIPIDNLLQRKGVILASRCFCCFAFEESLLHLFVESPLASEVWQCYAKKFGILDSKVSSISSLLLL